MDLLKTISELEDLVAKSKRFPLTDKCMVDEEALIRLTNNIREQWPSALKEAEEITQNRDKIIADAREEAKNIIAQAKAYAQKQVNENTITVAAKEKAKAILEKTHNQSEAIRNESVQYRNESIQYAGQILEHVIVYMQNAQNTVEAAKQSLKDVQKRPIAPPDDKTSDEQPQEPPKEQHNTND